MTSIKIIATRDTEGLFPRRTGEVIKEVNTEKVAEINANSKSIRIRYKNGLLEIYRTDAARLEVIA